MNMIVITEKATNRKAIKNPFYKIHVAAQECNRIAMQFFWELFLKRKEMMKEAIAELRKGTGSFQNLLEKG